MSITLRYEVQKCYSQYISEAHTYRQLTTFKKKKKKHIGLHVNLDNSSILLFKKYQTSGKSKQKETRGVMKTVSGLKHFIP